MSAAGTYLFWVIAGFAAARLLIVWVNLLSRPYLRRQNLPFPPPKVSVLIPARNEAHTLPRLLNDLCRQNLELHEVLILDDGSTDGTADKALGHEACLPGLRILTGEALPTGWLGKNWACHQLAEQASGDYLVFLDADVRLQPEALSSAVAALEDRRLDLLSIFPDQEMATIGEKILVPIMPCLLLTLLPLPLIRHSRNPAFAAANGQFLLFTAKAYKPYNWHHRLRAAVTEDIEILRALKKEKLRTALLLGGSLVNCRMYTGYAPALQGFSKNLYLVLGGRTLGTVLYFGLTYISWLVLPWLAPAAWCVWLLCILVAIKLSVAFMARQNPIEQLVLTPVQFLAWPYLGLLSLIRRYKGQNEWKGRRIPA